MIVVDRMDRECDDEVSTRIVSGVLWNGLPRHKLTSTITVYDDSGSKCMQGHKNESLVDVLKEDARPVCGSERNPFVKINNGAGAKTAQGENERRLRFLSPTFPPPQAGI